MNKEKNKKEKKRGIKIILKQGGITKRTMIVWDKPNQIEEIIFDMDNCQLSIRGKETQRTGRNIKGLKQQIDKILEQNTSYWDRIQTDYLANQIINIFTKNLNHFFKDQRKKKYSDDLIILHLKGYLKELY
jgi:hypothetical protein